jgi:hypothetical protein
MERFKVLLVVIVVLVSSVLAAARFLLIEVHDFWLFLQHLQW